MANVVQRIIQRAIGIRPQPNYPGIHVIKSYRNRKNTHLIELGDKLIVDSEKGTYFGVYTGGDPYNVTNLKDPRLLSN